jgi:hypothetical protein
MILNRNFISIACGPTIFGQSKSDEWHLFADSELIILALQWLMVK